MPGQQPETASGLWKDKKSLVISPSASLPERCIFCNRNSTTFRVKKLVVPPARVARGIVGGTAMLLSKRFSFTHADCGQHPFWKAPLFIGGITLVLGLCLIIGGIPLLHFYGLAAALGAWLLGAGNIGVFAYFFPKDLAIEKVEGNRVWIRGICQDFLAEIPALDGDAP